MWRGRGKGEEAGDEEEKGRGGVQYEARGGRVVPVQRRFLLGQLGDLETLLKPQFFGGFGEAEE